MVAHGLEHDANSRHRALELVRRIGDETALLRNGSLEAREHIIERGCQRFQVAIVLRHGQAAAQIADGYRRGLRAHALDRRERARDGEPREHRDCAQGAKHGDGKYDGDRPHCLARGSERRQRGDGDHAIGRLDAALHHEDRPFDTERRSGVDVHLLDRYRKFLGRRCARLLRHERKPLLYEMACMCMDAAARRGVAVIAGAAPVVVAGVAPVVVAGVAPVVVIRGSLLRLRRSGSRRIPAVIVRRGCRRGSLRT